MLIEAVIPDHAAPHWAKLLDIQMLTLLTGKQRTRHEHGKLLADSGFHLQREIEVGGNFSILEAAAA